MSAFDGIFKPAQGSASALFADTKVTAGLNAAPGSKTGIAAVATAAPEKAPTLAKTAKSEKSGKRKRSDVEVGRPADKAGFLGKKQKRGKQSAAAAAPAAAAVKSASAAGHPQFAERQAPVAPPAAAGKANGESAAAKAARAAAAKLLRQSMADEEDEEPPLHETLQRQAAQAKKQKKRKQAQAQAQAPDAAAQQVSMPAERLHSGDAAPAEQPLDAAPNGIEQAREHSTEDKLERTIFVGNLRATLKPKAIKQLFSRYGSVESVRLRSVPVQPEAVALPRRAAVLTGKVDAERATAHAYVVFAEPQQAQAALAHNMQVVDGLHLRVDMATGAAGTAAAKTYSRGRSIFVGNLHFTAQDEDLVQLFSDGGLDPELQDAVTAVRVVRDRQTNIGKGIAFVEFKTKAAAAAAMRLAEPKLHGRPLRISFLKQPKASAIAAAEALPVVAKPGADADGSQARERLRKQKMAASSKKAARQPWMGERTKGPQKAAAKGAKPVVAGPRAGVSKPKHGGGGGRGRPPARAAARKQGRGGGGRDGGRLPSEPTSGGAGRGRGRGPRT